MSSAIYETAQYVPIAAYSLLFVVSGWRLWVHRQPCKALGWGRMSLSVGSASKFWFHLFLFMFAVTKVLQSTLAISSLPADTQLPEFAFNLVSGCSYITLLLFLEMHWRQILKPLSAMRSKRKTWGLFWTFNVLLYAIVFVAAFTEVRGDAHCPRGPPPTGSPPPLPAAPRQARQGQHVLVRGNRGHPARPDRVLLHLHRDHALPADLPLHGALEARRGAAAAGRQRRGSVPAVG